MIFSSLRFYHSAIALMIFAMPFTTVAKKIIDITGTEVTIPDKPKRIILGESRMLYTLLLLQPEDPVAHIAGWPEDLAYYDPQSFRWFQHNFPQITNVPILGKEGVASINIEKLLALKPDLVILPSLAKNNANEENLTLFLKRAGIPVVKIDLRVDLLHNSQRSVAILGQIFNQQQRAQLFNQFYTAHQQLITAALSHYTGARARVFLHLHLGRNNDCCITTVNGSLGQLITLAGGRNIAENRVSGVFGRISTEALLSANPDFYFATGIGNNTQTSSLQFGPEVTQKLSQQSYLSIVKQQMGLNQLPAIQSGKGGLLWHNFYLSPWHIIAAEFIAKTLYPQLFVDLNPEKSLQWLLNFAHLPFHGSFFSPLPELKPQLRHSGLGH